MSTRPAGSRKWGVIVPVAIILIAIIALLLLLIRPTPSPRPQATPTAASTVATVGPAASPSQPGMPTRTATNTPEPDPVALTAGVYKPPAAVKSSGCQYQHAADGAALPDPGCTTGATDPRLTKDVICAPGFRTKPYRDGPLALPGPVTQQVKDAAYARYSIASHSDGQYEVDHLIALEDGGDDDPVNLWPQPSSPTPGYHEKDMVETYVHNQVCAGALVLSEAQRQLASDWTAFLTVSSSGVRSVQPKQHDGDQETDD